MTISSAPADSLDHRIDAVAKSERARTRRRALLRVLAFACIGIAACFVGGFGIYATQVGSMRAPAVTEKVDAIVVLTGGQARLSTAFDLLRSGKGRRMLITGVNPETGPRDLSPHTGADRELFNCCVDFDYRALDTIGNASESGRWLRRHGFQSALIVTNNYHMPRTMLELSRETDAELVPYPVVNTPLDHGRWLVEPKALPVLFKEYAKYLAAGVRNLAPQQAQQVAHELFVKVVGPE